MLKEFAIAFERSVNERVDARFDEKLYPVFRARIETFLLNIKGEFDESMRRNRKVMDETADDISKLGHAIQNAFHSDAQVQDLKTRLRDEINNETFRCKNANAALVAALGGVLKRVASVEKTQMELQSQLNEAVEQRAKDATTISDLKVELGRALQSIATMNTVAARGDSILKSMKLDVAEALWRAENAERKANTLDGHVKRWLDEELRKKREAEEIERLKREAGEARRRAREEAEAEEARKNAKAEAEERRRQAEAKAAKEAEEARLKEEARKAEEERQRREAEAERERTRAKEERREKERKERIQQELLGRWKLYEAPHSPGELRFDNIVWPVLVQPHDLSGLTRGAIDYFILSDLHSEGKSRKSRLNDALLRWHSDKYGLIESRVLLAQRPLVKQAFHEISIHLNNLKSTLP